LSALNLHFNKILNWNKRYVASHQRRTCGSERIPK